MLDTQIETFLRTHRLLGNTRTTHFLLAFSGGRDSTALLYGLSDLKNRLQNVEITLAYYAHPWRPLAVDLQYIYQHAKRLGLPWVVITPNLNLPHSEADARNDRYDQLGKLALDLQATAILTAHHQDDLIETMLFRLFRGTGLDGLKGIPPIRALAVERDGKDHEIPVARPLLTICRDEINQFIQAKSLTFVDDPTNTDVRFKRNAVRHDILPQIEAHFPKVRQALMTLAQHAEGDLQVIDTKIQDIWHMLYDPKARSLDETGFLQLSQPFQQRIMRQFLDEYELSMSFKSLTHLLDVLNGTQRQRTEPILYSLNDTRFLHVYRGSITIEFPEKRVEGLVNVSIPGSVTLLPLRTTITIEELSFEERLKSIDPKKVPENEVLVDLTRILKTGVKQLIFRTRRQGDRITPLGMSKPMKLKGLLINRNIPRFQREHWPVVAIEDPPRDPLPENPLDAIGIDVDDTLTQRMGNVMWAAGLALNHHIKVVDRPTHRIRLVQAEVNASP